MKNYTKLLRRLLSAALLIPATAVFSNDLDIQNIYTSEQIGNSSNVYSRIAVGDDNRVWVGHNATGTTNSCLYVMDTAKNWAGDPLLTDRNIGDISKGYNGQIWVADRGRSGTQAVNGGVTLYPGGSISSGSRKYGCCTAGTDKISSRNAVGVIPLAKDIAAAISMNTFSIPASESRSGAIDKIDHALESVENIAYKGGYYNFNNGNFTADYHTFLSGAFYKSEIWVSHIVHPLTGSPYSTLESYRPDSPIPTRTYSEANSIFPLNAAGQFPRVQDVFADSKGYLWVGINAGSTDISGNAIARMSDQNVWQVLRIGHKIRKLIAAQSSVSINSISEGKDGTIWFATNFGLIAFDGKDFDKDESWGYFGDSSGLPSTIINDIAFNPNDGNMWLATSNGVVEIAFCQGADMDTITYKIQDVLVEDGIGIKFRDGFVGQKDFSVRLWAIHESGGDTIKFPEQFISDDTDYHGTYITSDFIPANRRCEYRYELLVTNGLVGPQIKFDLTGLIQYKGDTAKVWYPQGLIDEIIKESKKNDNIHYMPDMYDVDSEKLTDFKVPFFSWAVADSFAHRIKHKDVPEVILSRFWRFYLLQKHHTSLLDVGVSDQSTLPFAFAEIATIRKDQIENIIGLAISKGIVNNIVKQYQNHIPVYISVKDKMNKQARAKLLLLADKQHKELVNYHNNALSYILKAGFDLSKDLDNTLIRSFTTDLTNKESMYFREVYSDNISSIMRNEGLLINDFQTAANVLKERVSSDLEEIETDVADSRRMRLASNVSEITSNILSVLQGVAVLAYPIAPGVAVPAAQSLSALSTIFDWGAVALTMLNYKNHNDLTKDIENIRSNYNATYGKDIFWRKGGSGGLFAGKYTLSDDYVYRFLPEVKEKIVAGDKSGIEALLDEWADKSLVFSDTAEYMLFQVNGILSGQENIDSTDYGHYIDLVKAVSLVNVHDMGILLNTMAFLEDSSFAGIADSFDIRYAQLTEQFQQFRSQWEYFEPMVETTPILPILICKETEADIEFINNTDVSVKYKVSNITDQDIENASLIIRLINDSGAYQIDTLSIGTIQAGSSAYVNSIHRFRTEVPFLVLEAIPDAEDVDGYGMTSLFNVKDVVTTFRSDNSRMPVRIYPNPANKLLTIVKDMDAAPVHFNIINVTGAVLRSGMLSGKSEIDISGLSEGLYYVYLYSDNTASVLPFVKISK